MILRRVLGLCMMAMAVGPALGATPTIDQARLVYMYEPDVRVASTPKGEVCFDHQIEADHDECAARYAKRPLPMPHASVRTKGLSPTDPRGYGALQGFDANGRAWFSASGEGGQWVWRVTPGKPEETVTRRYNWSYNIENWGPRPQAQWPYNGHEVLVDKAGTAWLIGTDRIVAVTDLEGKKEKEILLPVPANAAEAEDLRGARGPYWSQQLYSLGDAMWILRSTYTNSNTPGAFVLRVAGDSAHIACRLPKQFATAVVKHGDAYYFFAEDPIRQPGQLKESLPARIYRLRFRSNVEAETIRTQVALLDSPEYARRKAAKDFLRELDPVYLPVIGEAAKTLSGMESREVADAIVQRLKTGGIVEESTFEGAKSARLLLMDRAGRQFVQPWRDARPQPELLISDQKETLRVKLPRAKFVLDCQGDDERLYGHDDEMIYAFKAPTFAPEEVASLGVLKANDLRIIAVNKGLACLSVRRSVDTYDHWTPAWVDLARQEETPVLAGKVISHDLPEQANGGEHFPTVVGSDGKLWFVRQWTELAEPIEKVVTESSRSQLCRVEGDGVARALTEELETCRKVSVWVLGPRTAAVVAGSGHGPEKKRVFFFNAGSTGHYESLQELVVQEKKAILKVMPDGAAFVSGEHYEQSWLIRTGRAVYVQFATFGHQGNTSGTIVGTGVMREEDAAVAWRTGFSDFQPDYGRILDVDKATGRVLVFKNDYSTLAWVNHASGAEQMVEGAARKPWAWQWRNATSLPRFTGSWMLTPKAADTLQTNLTKRAEERKARGHRRDGEEAPRAGDFTGCQRLTGNGFRVSNAALFNGVVWEDGQGNIWLQRLREAEVFFRDGRRQLIEQDATDWQTGRLVVESPTAVWVASAESLTRYIVKDGGYEKSVRYRLPGLGGGFGGPWIAGETMYWVCGKTLYGAPLKGLIERK